MRRFGLLAVLALAAAGCQSTLDKQATAANLSNVHAIVDVNERYLAADTVRAPSIIKLERDANKAAVQLAESMNASAGK